MANVTLCSPVEGKGSGESITVSKDKADWLIANGYATDGSDTDHLTDVSPGDYPTDDKADAPAKPAKRTSKKS